VRLEAESWNDWPFSWPFSFVDDRLNTLLDFGHDMEEWSAREGQRFRDHLDERAEKITDETQRNEFFEWHLDTVVKYDDEYPQLCRELILVKANFLLEAELVALAKWLQKERHLQSFPAYKKALHKAGNHLSEIGYAARFIEDGGLAFPRGAAWCDVEAIVVLRNAIVHNAGALSKKRDGVLQGSRLKGLVDIRHGRLRFSHPVHQQVVAPIREVFQSLEATLYPADVEQHQGAHEAAR
jgi:hypothetical protein